MGTRAPNVFRRMIERKSSNAWSENYSAIRKERIAV